MLHENRIDYLTIKNWLLDAYYDFCRDRGVVLGMSHLEVIGYVDYEYEKTFERPIEQLMFRVGELIISGGWYNDFEKNVRKIMDDLFVKYDLNGLLQDLPSEEADLFKHDLRILGLLPI